MRWFLLIMLTLVLGQMSFGDANSDILVTISVHDGPLIDVGTSLVSQLKNRVGFSKEAFGAAHISVEATKARLSVVLLQLKDQNICAWRHIEPPGTPDLGDFQLGYCNGELPFPNAMYVPYP
jgi:hypothetical protein